MKGRGSRVWDLDGNEYLDLCGKFGANILGHNDERYVEGIAGTLREISAANLGTAECETAELICAFVPGAEMVRFSLSGTDAVQNALRLARAHTGKNRFIRFHTHYHGSADNLLGGAVGDLAHPVPREFPGDAADTLGKARDVLRDQSFLLPWNDAEALARVLDAHGDDVAAVLMEPVCMNGGGVWPAPGYLENVRRLCDAHGALLVFDEIITGFRMGPGGAQEQLGVTPDLTTLGKAMAGGALPVSAVAGSREVMRLYEDRRVVHGGTFNGYPLGMAAVRSTLRILRDSGGAGHLEMAKRLRGITTALLDAAERHGFRLEMRGIDACGIFHFAEDGPSRGRSQHLPLMLLGEALAGHGILASNLNRLYGNLSLTPSDEEFFAQRIEDAFTSVRASLRKLLA
ncbi:aspartate aminotransferase family protein [Nonomuraea lactucae]|uniref:aspartate aminotransferase family protein n=1 Tax=Nonomuraea lactucae TaxID=2249762 RepID=UPI00196454A1|nr:aminotransferase class III-fold pyridoxal phosphate-dependent enzyme [Nonomuraea lactucae]